MISSSELSIIIPVYNEEAVIEKVIREWQQTLSHLHISLQMIVLDDGSTDNSAPLLNNLQREFGNIHVVYHDKSHGHGPTILEGYRLANSKWIFQIDSDDEMSPQFFQELWNKRNDFDLLLGHRTNRVWPMGRRFVSDTAKRVVRFLFGNRVSDVNTPYRLMNGSCFSEIFKRLPTNTLTPNIALTGFAIKKNLRIIEIPVPHVQRKTGQSVLIKWRLWIFCVRAFGQLLSIRRLGA